MNLFTITFDQFTGEFESQYPIVLLDKGVTPQEFANTVYNVSAISKVSHQQHVALSKKFINWFIASMLTAFAAIAISLSIILVMNTRSFRATWFLYLIPFWAILFVLITLGGVKWKANKHKKLHEATKQALINQLEMENQQWYYQKGIQFMLKYSSEGYGTYLTQTKNRTVSPQEPTIEILSSYGGTTSSAMTMTSQPPQPFYPSDGHMSPIQSVHTLN